MISFDRTPRRPGTRSSSVRSRRAVLAVVLLALPALAQAQAPAPAPSGPGTEDPLIARLVEAHNKERAKEKLPPLKAEARLEEAARLHARDMADREAMTHDGGDGSKPAQRIARAGYHYLISGENVARGYTDVASVMQGWMDSPPHKKNILGDFTEIGAARAEGKDGKWYWCADFGKPMPRFEPAVAAAELFRRINVVRAVAQQPTLTVEPALAKAAQDGAAEMAKNKSKSIPPALLDSVDQRKFREVAMSAAIGRPDAEDVVKGMMSEPENRERILGKYSKVGIGYATAEDGIPYWCLILAVPANR